MIDWSSTLDVPESDDEERAGSEVMALVIAWAAGEPDRAGEVALLPADGAPWILGRGRDPRETVQPTSRRVEAVRQRPAILESRPPLSARGLSREQLRLVAGDDRIVVESIGRCPMSSGGEPVQQCTLRPGDTLLLRNQLLLFCTRRPREMRLLRDFP